MQLEFSMTVLHDSFMADLLMYFPITAVRYCCSVRIYIRNVENSLFSSSLFAFDLGSLSDVDAAESCGGCCKLFGLMGKTSLTRQWSSG